MKGIKAVKLLKFWSRKKKPLVIESPPPPSRPPPPPPYYHTIHRQYEPIIPSAPPLPDWFEHDCQFQEQLDFNASQDDHNSSVPEITSHDSQTGNSRCMVLDPVYEPLLVPELERSEKNNGVFGCMVSFGALLVRCVFQCFHVRKY